MCREDPAHEEDAVDETVGAGAGEEEDGERGEEEVEEREEEAVGEHLFGEGRGRWRGRGGGRGEVRFGRRGGWVVMGMGMVMVVRERLDGGI